MTADELRQASGEMRRLAEAAMWPRFADEQVAEWTYDGNPSGAIMAGGWCIGQASAYGDGRGDNRLAEYIAAWHPAVALAVANWLDTVADACTSPDDVEAPMSKTVGRTIAHVDEEHAHIIARAFLGTTP